MKFLAVSYFLRPKAHGVLINTKSLMVRHTQVKLSWFGKANKNDFFCQIVNSSKISDNGPKIRPGFHFGGVQFFFGLFSVLCEILSDFS